VILKRSFFWIFLLSISVSCAGIVEAAGTVVGSVANAARVAPVGSSSASPTEYNMFQLRVSAVGSSETLRSVQLRNLASVVRFGDGISRVRIFHDSDGVTGLDTTSDTVVGSTTFSTLTRGTVSIDFNGNTNAIDAGNSSTYFVVYDIASTAPLLFGDENTTTNIEIVSVQAQSGLVPFSNSTTANIVTLSGISSLLVEDVAPDVVLPGQQKVPMLKLTVRAVGENMTSPTFIRVDNRQDNLSPSSNPEAGIKRVHLYYRDPNREDITVPFNKNRDLILQTLDSSDFLNTGSFAFTNLENPNNRNSSFVFSEGADHILFVVYDIGDEFEVNDETEFDAELTSFTGTGQQSSLTMTAEVPSHDPANSFVAGLTFDEDQSQSIVSNVVTYGQGSIVPMLQFVLRANHSDITVNQLVINNLDVSNRRSTSTVPYITNSTGTQGIKRIQVFEDANLDQEFDGIGAGDTLIADLILDGASNTNREATLQVANGNGILIKKFDDSDHVSYPNNNERNFFVLYHVGPGEIVEARDASGNTNARASAFIKNARGISSVAGEVVTMNLRGVLPFTSTPSARVDLVQSNLYISSVSSIVPAFALQGETKVPMLYVQIQSDLQGTTIPSASVSIRNAVATGLNQFSGINQGVSRVWLYRDEDADRVLDSTDTLLSSRRVNSSDSATLSQLFSVPFTVDRLHNFFVLYDIGQLAVTTANSAQAQLSSIESDGETAVVFSGDRPVPAVPALLRVEPKRLLIDQVTVVDADSDINNGFRVQVRLTNTSNQTVSLVTPNGTIPKFYLANVGGKDISSEFSTSVVNVQLDSLRPRESGTVEFNVSLDRQVSEGTVVVDASSEYITPSRGTAIATRYFGPGQTWVSGARTTGTVYLPTPRDREPGDYPSYIDSVKVSVNGLETTFQNGTSVRSGSNMVIRFQDKGSSLDGGSLKVRLNNVDIPRRSTTGELSSATFSYDEDLGKLTVQDLGNANGTLKVSATDLQGNILEDLDLNFLISSSVVNLSRLLFFPSPYRVTESQPLVLSFNISREATIRIYIYDYRGQKVFEDQQQASTVGYNEISFPSDSSFIKSGMYICRIVAVDTNGNKSVATTKFAIY
jgi:hypothetical protein